MSTAPQFTWSDSWLLFAVALAATRGQGTLADVIAWGDAINHAIFTAPELRRGFAKLIAAGHVTHGETFGVSGEVQRMIAEAESRGVGPRKIQQQLEKFLDAAPYPAGHPRWEDPQWPFPELTDTMVSAALKAYKKRLRHGAE